jgi:hypothetical protein
MRVIVLFLTSGITTVLSYRLNISCPSPFHASLGIQPAAGISVVPAHPFSLTQISSSSSEAATFPRSSPPLVRHVQRTVSALGRIERAAPTGGRGYRGRGTRASDGRNCNNGDKGSKVGDDGTEAARVEVEAAAVADAARAAAAELEALRTSSTDISISIDNDRGNELKLVREAA